MMKKLLTFACLLLAIVATTISAESQDKKKPKKIVAVTEAQAGPDFKIQGEYSGELIDDEGKMGIQVIALGDGQFRAVGFRGGLPGDGWNKSEGKIEAKGVSKDGVITFSNEKHGTAVLKDGVLTLADPDGKKAGTLKKVVRKSSTLGAKPPEGAVVLFDGKNADQFKNGKISDDGHLIQGTMSKPTFGDFKLHMEFRLSFMPSARGQGRSNSGCYMQGRYEVQVLDSFGLAGKHNECGGIYSVKEPNINMCFPPLSWQTYDVDFTAAKYDDKGEKTANARMTVLHNGFKIHDNVEVPKGTTAHPTKVGPEPGPIYFQNHGNPVRYRNIWVVPTR
jgi:hypothetical protein